MSKQVLIYGQVEKIYGKEGIIVCPVGTKAYGIGRGLILIKGNRRLHNTPNGEVILSEVNKIECKKDGNTKVNAGVVTGLWPNQKFKHVFGKGAILVANKDGSFIIGSTKGKLLWKWFDYGYKEIDV